MVQTMISFGLLLLVLSFPPSANSQEQKLNELAGTYVSGHRFAGTTLTLEPDGSYFQSSQDCTTQHSESGTYVLSANVLHFKILKRTVNNGEDIY